MNTIPEESISHQVKSPCSPLVFIISFLFVAISLASVWLYRENIQLKKNLLSEKPLYRVTEDTPLEKESTQLSQLTAEVGKTQEPVYPVSSEYRAFVKVNKDGFLNITPVETEAEPSVITQYGTLYSGGALGQGTSGVVLAPDMQKFALIQNQAVVIESVDGKISQNIPLKGVEYITGWSPDSNKLLTYVFPDNIKNSLSFGGPGYVPENQFVVDSEVNPEGFVLINFATGEVKPLHELAGLLVYSWAGNDALILSSGLGQSEFFMHYSLSEGKVDREKVSALNEVFGQQMDFTSDGKIWATVTGVGKNTEEGAQAAIGNFPNIGDLGKIQYPWARRQHPVLSPQARLLALEGYEILNGPRYVYLFDGQTLESIAEGVPEVWLDETQLVFSKDDQVFVYNTGSKKITQLR